MYFQICELCNYYQEVAAACGLNILIMIHPVTLRRMWNDMLIISNSSLPHTQDPSGTVVPFRHSGTVQVQWYSSGTVVYFRYSRTLLEQWYPLGTVVQFRYSGTLQVQWYPSVTVVVPFRYSSGTLQVQ